MSKEAVIQLFGRRVGMTLLAAFAGMRELGFWVESIAVVIASAIVSLGFGWWVVVFAIPAEVVRSSRLYHGLPLGIAAIAILTYVVLLTSYRTWKTEYEKLSAKFPARKRLVANVEPNVKRLTDDDVVVNFRHDAGKEVRHEGR